MTSSKPCSIGSAVAGLFLGLGLSLAGLQAQAAATIVIQNANAAGVGFNDPTPAAPVGGNAGTTLGQQRLIAFQAAADIWGATLTSSQTIVILASFEPLTCTATTAVLGSAGAFDIESDFPGAPKSNTWYPLALANKISGLSLAPGTPDIRARFNSRLGLFPDCLPGQPFYLGLDNNHGNLLDLMTVLLHEFGHGLGFQTFTDGNTGEVESGLASIWDHFMFDNTINKLWVNMTDAERAASARNTRKLAWAGANVTNNVPQVLSLGTPRLNISGPAAGPMAGDLLVGAASFGAQLSTTPVVGQLMPVVDQANGTGLACTTLSAANATAVRNNIALVDRGTCTFKTKAKNAQDAGAIGVVLANNAVGSPPPGLGDDATVTGVVIPMVSVSQADGIALKAQLNRRSRTTSGVIANLGVNGSQYAGADLFGRALLYTPNPYQPGSSVSHYDQIAFRNLLMEPAINGDLLHQVIPPADLTFPLLQDIGW